MPFLSQQTYLSLLFLSVQYMQISQGTDDLVESPLFEFRPESKSLQDIQANLDILKEKNKGDEPKTDHEVHREREDGDEAKNRDEKNNPALKRIKKILSKFLSTLKRNKRKAHSGGKSKKEAVSPEWQKWTDWSACSVTCGKGREIRWRHCQDNCREVETEMEEQSCQLPECPRKLFGFIKLN